MVSRRASAILSSNFRNNRQLKHLAFILLFFAAGLPAKWGDLSSTVLIEPGYDSNPALLTVEEREMFEGGHPDFIRLESYDDSYLRAGCEINYLFRLGKIRAETGLLYRYTHYFFNREKSYHYIKTGIELRRKKWRGEFSFTLIPEYASRLYGDTDEPDEPYFWSTFSTTRFAISGRYEAISNHWVAIETEYETDRYNDHFPEYDGTGYKVGPVWRWTGPIYVKFGYAYRVYDARGYDTEAESKLDSDKSDISYVEDRLETYVSRDFGDFTVGFSSDLSRRYYTSEKPFTDDYIHIARRDLRADIEPFIRLEATRKLELTLSCAITIRDSDSPYYDLDPIKDYNRAIFSVRAEYEI